MPRDFLTREASLPKELEYFDGHPPERLVSGSPWKQAHFSTVDTTREIFTGFHLIVTRSEKPGTQEMNELSLAVSTPQGLAVIVGCSDPGVAKILAAAAQINPRLYAAIGGFHLVRTPDAEIQRLASVLRDQLHLQRVAPAHCTSELGFSRIMQAFGDRYDRAGLGSVIVLPN